MARPKKKVKTPEETIQEIMSSMIVDGEYRSAAGIQEEDNTNYDSLIDMLDCRRNEKSYEWMSDYYIPEMNSIIHTEASAWAGTMFSTRDFVEVKLDGEQPVDDQKAKAAKKVINKTLNDRDLFYYPKYMRLRTINALKGNCYIVAWWEQEKRTETITVMKPKIMNIDIYGAPITDPNTQQPQVQQVPVNQEIEYPVVDHFNFDVLDPRNVFTDNKYCYSIQQKDWVIIRTEGSYDELKAKEELNDYFNLSQVKEAIKEQGRTETDKQTYGKETNGEYAKTPKKYFDIIDRYGKFWAVVQERDDHKNPIRVTPGLDEDGMPKDDAELIEMIITFVVVGNHKIMIRFVPTPYIDALGKPFKPIARGLCYVHPVKDEGLSDGQNMKELQIGINDAFNIGADRVKLATLPTFKGRKNSLDDNQSIYIEPEHVIELENMDDLQELKISDNIQGSLEQLGMLTSKLQQVTAVYPSTMGAMAGKSGTTATEIAGTENRTNARSNYKSLTFEYTFLQEFYWIILQMTQRFAMDETLIKMLGDSAQFFDANQDYTYSPVTSAIETEHNKYRKLQMIDQFIGRLAGLQNPKMAGLINYLMSMAFEAFDKEFPQYKKFLLDESAGLEGTGTLNQTKDGSAPPASNQGGVGQSGMEEMARASSQGMGGM